MHDVHFRTTLSRQRRRRNPFLIAEGVTIDPDALSAEALRERTWQVLEPHYLKRLAGLVEMFGAARTKELGDDDLAQIAPNAAADRVGNATHRGRPRYSRAARQRDR
jgi:hypothetical protein